MRLTSTTVTTHQLTLSDDELVMLDRITDPNRDYNLNVADQEFQALLHRRIAEQLRGL